MRVFLISLFALSIGLAHGAPQGYNYQSQQGESELSPEQYQLVQEYLQQQQQQQQSEPRIVFQQQQQQQHQQQQLEQQSQSAANNGGSYQFANHFQQYEAQQQHQQQQQQQQVQSIVAIKPVQLEAPVRHHEESIQVFQRPQQVPLSQSQLQYQQPQQLPQQPQQPRPQFNKEFYYLAAPQEDYVEPKDLQDQLAALKKNLRVVFIRAPEHNGLADAAAKLIKQSSEQQTKIYVLTKQHDASNLANKLNQLQSNSKSPKPEVIFIKYRTPQEAEQAQRTIQEQYQALDGPNHYNFEGVAQTHDFVANNGIDPRSPTSSSSISSSSSSSLVATGELSAGEKPVGEYLPATKKK